MATISITVHKGKTVLFVQCFEPMTKLIPTIPPYDRQILASAVEVCSGARMQQIGYEHISSPMDFGDERYDFGLELTSSNVLALKATGFEWSQEAVSLAAAFSVSDESVQKLRDEAIV